MGQLVAIAFPTQDRAQQVMRELAELQGEELIDLEDAVYVTKDERGRVRLHQGEKLAAWGGVSGALWGMLFGVLFFVPLLGTAIGAGLGALTGAAADYGIDDDFMRRLAGEMKPGSSAVFVLLRRAEPDRVLPRLARFGGTVLHTSLAADAEERLRHALSADGPAQPAARAA
jgi:uncharacterized membrane protein